MADGSRPVSSFLFCKEDGQPITFFMRPSHAKARLKPLVEARGGEISSKVSNNKDCIKLAADEDKITTDGYIEEQYIDDCIEANQLLPLDKYRINPKHPRPDSPAGSVMSNVSCKGRIRYTSDEDTAILSYIAKHRECSYSGNQVWKKMEILKITDHSWQSMKDRFLKKLAPSLPDFVRSQRGNTEGAAASSPKDGSNDEDVIADSSTANESNTSMSSVSEDQTQVAELATKGNPSTSAADPAKQGEEPNTPTEVEEGSKGFETAFEDYLAEEHIRKKVRCSSKDTETCSDSAEERPLTDKRPPRSLQTSPNKKRVDTKESGDAGKDSTKETARDERPSSKRSRNQVDSTPNSQETSQRSPRKEPTQPKKLATEDIHSASESEPGTQDEGPSSQMEDSYGSQSDFDDYLVQAAEANIPKKIGDSTESTGLSSDAAEEETRATKTKRQLWSRQVSSKAKGKLVDANGAGSSDSTVEIADEGPRSSKRSKRHRSPRSDTDLVAGVLANIDTNSEPDLSQASSSDPEFQAEVKRVSAFAKELVEDYSLPALTAMQLLYFHSLDLDAVLDHLETGESKVVWTKENDEKLHSSKPEDIKELLDTYGEDEVMKRQAFFDT